MAEFSNAKNPFWSMTRPASQALHASDRTIFDRSGESDEAIVTRILSLKDPTPFAILVTRYRRKLVALARTTLAGTAAAGEAEDVVQDAFVSAFDNLRSFRSSASFRPWLYKIVLNRCTDRLRAVKRISGDIELDGYPDRSSGPMEIAVANDEAKRIDDAVSTLPPVARAIFLLRHVDDLTYDELASITNLPVGTVKSHLFRARTKIREMLKDDQLP